MSLIYCVEDDEDIRDLVVYAVKSSGFEAEGCSNAEELFNALKKRIPDMVILDIMLPDQSGTKVLKELRGKKNTEEIPVIFLTAKSSEADKVKGFDLGADDYVTKPFGVLELISRIKAVLRRTQKDSRTVIELLCILLRHKGSAVTREVLLSNVWGYDFEGESRTLDVHIGSLRHKLGQRGSCIETVRNVGYRIS